MFDRFRLPRLHRQRDLCVRLLWQQASSTLMFRGFADDARTKCIFHCPSRTPVPGQGQCCVQHLQQTLTTPALGFDVVNFSRFDQADQRRIDQCLQEEPNL